MTELWNPYSLIGVTLLMVVLLQTFGRGFWRSCPLCGRMQEHARDCPRRRDPGEWS